MAKKKTTKVSEKSTSFQQAIGIDNIFHNERINFVLGFCLLFIAGYLTWAFASFLVTGDADQSMIEAPRAGEILNQNKEFQNACGSLGAYASWFFIKRCFGLAAFLIPVFILMVSVRLMRAYQVKLLKWFMCLTLVMIWSSITMAKFLVPLFEDACYNPGGDHGLAVSQQIEGLIGIPGLVAVLALCAIAFLTYLSMETVIILRKLFNPLRYLKKIPMEIHIGKGDSEDEKTEVLNTLEDPSVFDDPQEQVVEFNDLNTPKPDEVIHETVVTPNKDNTKSKEDDDDIDMEIEEASEEEAAKGNNLVGKYGDIKVSQTKNDNGTTDLNFFYMPSTPFYKDAIIFGLKGHVQEVITENAVAENPLERFAKNGKMENPDITERKYDRYGYLMQGKMLERQGMSIIDYEYDKQNRLVKRTLTNKAANITYIHEYVYNDNDEILNLSQKVFDEKNECVMSVNMRNNYEDHDDMGNWTRNALNIVYWEEGAQSQSTNVIQKRKIRYWDE